ncbi:hypothetical protein PanWU01x14_253010 [Parasponia andersonii]|uniref:RIK n=1 Tax=Parasponia andersonii TaxID=3476 RepID=A0A2P5BBL4_PARAD|nr:hypothetical protein PanWU01x14_253010 [Parasponia andersonii]
MGVRNVSTMPALKKLVPATSLGMPPPPSRTMAPPPPPPPPKFTSSTPALKRQEKNNILSKTKWDSVPDTLVKLMEYGDDDEDDYEGNSEEPLDSNSSSVAALKPFWAL